MKIHYIVEGEGEPVVLIHGFTADIDKNWRTGFFPGAPGPMIIQALAKKVKYVIDPNNPYPDNYTGHIRATLRDGTVVEERQPHLRGGAHEPLSRAAIVQKFKANAAFGGWPAKRIDEALSLAEGLFSGPVNLSPLRA